MRTLLLAGVIALVPFVAFAHGPQHTHGMLAFTGPGRLRVVQHPGHQRRVERRRQRFVVNGAVSGNYTDVTTKGTANLGKNTAKTNATATQVNVGGTSPAALPRGNASGTEAGWQNSQALGGSAAIGGNLTGSGKGIRAGQD